MANWGSLISSLVQLGGRLRAFVRPGSFDRDFDQELESHLDMLAEEHRRRGMTPEQARRAARLELGGLAQLREAHREVRGMPSLSALQQDVRYALRTLRRTPGFTATAQAAQARGGSATTAVFSLVNAVLLKPAPVPDPDRFVILGVGWPAKFAHWRAQTTVLQDVSAYMPSTMNYTGGEVVEQLRSMQISADALHCWGTPILLGRDFTNEEDAPDGPHVTVIGEDFWRRRFNGDQQILGRTISLNGVVYTIVGIAADSPVFREEGGPPDTYLPFRLDPNSSDLTLRFTAMARLKPGVTLEQANARLQVAAGEFRAKFPNALVPKDGFSAIPYREAKVGGSRPLLMILLGAVSLVLLIACANVANLLLVRAEGRRREIAIRAAIGAGRTRMIRQLLTESLLLSLAGGALGLLLGFAGIRALLAVNTAGLPRLGENGIAVAMDWRVMAFAVLVSLGTGILFGLFPALEGSRSDLNSLLKVSSGRAGTGLKQTKARAALVVGEVGLAVILLVGSALLIRTFVALYSVNLGFDVKNVITMRMKMTGPEYRESARMADAIRDGLERIRALPGVTAASATYFVPLQTAIGRTFEIVGKPSAQPGPFNGWVPAATGYFEVFKLPLKRGRTFNDRDGVNSPPVVVINESMARQYWKDADPLASPLTDRIVIGKGSIGFQDEPVRQIVGIVGDVRDTQPYNDPRPTMYVPQAQITDAMNAFLVRIQPVAWIVRTRDEPHSLVPAIREQLRQATGLPVSEVRSIDEVVSLSIARQRFDMLLMTVFGGAALLLAAIGIYGLMAYSVEQRTQEIGIRLALGAEAGQVRKMIVRQGMVLAMAGVVAGMGGAWGLSRLIESLLFGVKARDPLAFLAVPIALSLVALLAVWLPASRASRIDPIEALRYE